MCKRFTAESYNTTKGELGIKNKYYKLVFEIKFQKYVFYFVFIYDIRNSKIVYITLL